MLGHASATMTLDTYGHLFEDRLDEVAAAMDAARSAEREKAAASAREVVPLMTQFLRPIRLHERNRPNDRVALRAAFPQVRGPSGCVPPTGFEPALPP